MPKITVDFYSDWIAILRRELAAAGFTPASNETDQEICFRYFNLQKRGVTSTPRVVEQAPDFTVPSVHQDGVNLIIEKLKRGDDVTPHLSRSITNFDYDDAMLNDWGIHHLHLGTSLDDSGFAERTGPLLYARITRSHAYLLAVLGHGEWANRQLIEAVHANWPESISMYRLHGVLDVFDTPTDDEILQLRRGRVSTIVKTDDGTVYAPMGGGITTSGLSAGVVTSCDSYARTMKKLEQHVLQQSDKMVQKICEVASDSEGEIILRLHIIDGQFVAVDETSNVGFGLLQTDAE